MTEARSSGSRKALSFGVGLAMIFALAIPFVGTAVANHPAGATLEVSGETAENQVGSPHTLTARLFNDTTEGTVNAATDVRIHFEVESGPAGTVTADNQELGATPRSFTATESRTAPDMACTIAPGSSFCEVSFTAGSAGENLIRAWIDHDQLSSTFDGDGAEGRYAGGPTVPGSSPAFTTDCRNAATGSGRDPSCAEGTAVPGAAEPDTTDVVSKTWVQLVGARCIDAEPNDDTNPSGTDHVITAEVRDSANEAWADDDGTFDCPGNVVSGAQVRITVTDGTPAVTIDGTAVPAGGFVTKATGADGRVSFTVRCVDPNCTGENSFHLFVVGAQSGTGREAVGDDVDKTWAAAGVLFDFFVTPERDTNEVGQTHTVNCHAVDAFDNGVAGVNCDFRVIDGPNDTRAPVAPGTEDGYLGQCTTPASGICGVSYSSSAQGTDDIRGWNDRNGNNSHDGGEEFDIVFKHWVALGFGPAQVQLDMENQPDNTTPDAVGMGGDCVTFDSTAFANNVGRNHRVCARASNVFGTETPAPITFRIVSGPGFFTDGSGTSVNRGTEVTIQHDAAGGDSARTWIRSLQGGNTVVQACLEGTTTCSSNGTKPWIALPARTIAATPASATNPPGTQHEITATVLDRLGNPVTGQTVNWSRTGVGFVVSQETTTNAAGEARIVIRSDQEGTTSVTASIPVGERVECSRPANDPSGAPAGICTVTVSKTWAEPEEPDEIDRGVARSLCSNEHAGTERNLVGGGVLKVGTPGDDALDGTNEDDILCGLGGNDVLKGFDGNDELLGGGGNDVINGGRGRDLIRGGGGHDLIRGGRGHDNIRGGGGNDELFGGRGRDSLRGGRGHDTLNGQRGSDTMRAGRGNDLLRDVRGRRNFFNGGPGDDTCIGRRNRGNTYRRCNTLRQV